MITNFKTKSFKFVYWIMLVLLVVDSLDTIYRFVVTGYLGDGTTFPGVNSIIKPDTIDLVIFAFIQIGIVYGIFLLYRLKKVGGYWFLGSNIFYLVRNHIIILS